MSTLLLGPAYGRKYLSPAEALKDWDAGKDFRIIGGGPYTSKRDLEYMRVMEVSALNVCGNTILLTNEYYEQNIVKSDLGLMI